MSKIERIFVVNLLRRRDRMQDVRKRLLEANAPSIAPVEYFRAVDGLELNPRIFDALGIELYPTWKQEGANVMYYARDITMGEIGCALSHFYLWRRIVDDEIDCAIIIEDDANFVPEAFKKAQEALNELSKTTPDWDLCYVGRRRMTGPPFIEGPVPEEKKLGSNLVQAGFSYCTHAYAISLRGAKKLLAHDYEKRLVPVDEYMPALYSHHPRADVRELFGPGNVLVTAAIEPGLASQVREGVSDVEESAFVSTDDVYRWTTPAHEIVEQDGVRYLVAQSLREPVEFEVGDDIFDMVKWVCDHETFTEQSLRTDCPGGADGPVTQLLDMLVETQLLVRPLGS